MSMERCERCSRQIDTDFDTECYCEVGNMRSQTYEIILCEHCRGLAEVEHERAAADAAWWEHMAEEAEHERAS